VHLFFATSSRCRVTAGGKPDIAAHRLSRNTAALKAERGKAGPLDTTPDIPDMAYSVPDCAWVLRSAPCRVFPLSRYVAGRPMGAAFDSWLPLAEISGFVGFETRESRLHDERCAEE
jgi:hypothetical protein